MYRLTIVSGPNRGTTYPVQEGETTIGRQVGNTVVLQSAKVSKRHCVLVASGGELVVQDQGSSNGTFVNGVLAKSKKVSTGDRISVGEYVFELSEPPARTQKPAPVSLGGNVLQFPGSGPAAADSMSGGASHVPDASQVMPTDLKGKVLWLLEHRLMPYFYALNLKHEWRTLALGFMGVFVIANLVLSVSPLMEQARKNVILETSRRAKFMAQEIAERNAPLLASRMETKTEVGIIEHAEGVRAALLTDLDNRILAPGSRLNQYLNGGGEARLAIDAAKAFRDGRDKGVGREVDDSTYVYVEPVKILSQQSGRNVIVAMAIVAVDTTLSTPNFGEMSMVYSETLLLTMLVGGLLLFILYRITLKPLLTLNEDMDKVLKGEMPQVTHEFKVEELNPLWDIINSALQRLPKGGAGAMDAGGAVNGPSVDDYVGPLRMIGAVSKYGIIVCDADRKIAYLNPMFEEISGIRADGAIGQELGSVARDQSMAPFFNDLFDRASTGGEGAAEDYDFSGITYKCHGAGFGPAGTSARCFVIAAVRSD